MPGPVTSSASTGCHALLRAGAEVVTRAQDIVELVGRIGELAPEQPRPATPLDGLDDEERRVYEALPGRGGATIDEIAVAAAVEPGADTGAAGDAGGRWPGRAPGRLLANRPES